MQVLGDGYDVLNEKIDSASFTWTPRTSKEDAINYYKETYKSRGKEGWKQHIVRDLAAQTGIKPKNLERRFDPSRINMPEKKNAGQYKELGAQLPMKKEPKDLAGKRAKVTFRGTVCIPSGKDKKGQPKQDCREKNFTRTLDRTQTHEMMYGSFDPIFDAYQINPDVIGSIEVYDLQVEFI